MEAILLRKFFIRNFAFKVQDQWFDNKENHFSLRNLGKVFEY